MDEVLEIIKKFSTGKASGPFSIPIHILKEYSELLVNPLTCIVNKSLREGIFPALLKSARVCPIFKKGDKCKSENYRPISLLSNLSKVFERVFYSKLEHFLTEHEIIYKLQFGFRKKYSTNHALLSITEQIRHYLDKGTFACGVFVDLEKAFDTVNHNILLSKLDHYGIRGRSNIWLKSYLSNRDQVVKVNDSTSSKMNINCGVPQGSILGPLLFIIYINDMNKAVENCITHHFADDTNILHADKDPKLLKKSC
jgi:retron-type reverse transcriptase